MDRAHVYCAGPVCPSNGCEKPLLHRWITLQVKLLQADAARFGSTTDRGQPRKTHGIRSYLVSNLETRDIPGGKITVVASYYYSSVQA